MLQLESIAKSYSGEVLLDNVTFSLQKGERCGLVGRNGSGKTTLFRLITGEESPDKGTISKPQGYTIGHLNQHIAFSRSTVLEEASLGLPAHDQDSVHKVEKILFGLGFQERDLERSPSELSGGFHLRLHLTKLLVSEPHLLLLDEPTNYLDIVSIRWLTRFLKNWKGEFILISHDRQFVDEVCTHTLGIHRKEVHKIAGGTGGLFAQILQDEEVHERTRVNLEKKRQHAEAFVRRFGAKATKAAQAQSRMKAIQKMPVLEKLAQLYQLDFEFRDAPFSAKQMLQVDDLAFSYDGEPLIQGLTLTVGPQDRIAVIGKNGRGKSTILRLLVQNLKPQQGRIKQAENVAIGYFGQTNIDRLDPSKTIEDEISLANPRLTISEVRAICGAMMFSGDRAKKTIGVLSGGERSRVLLGKILANPCNLLLLDEPTHHLDMESIEALMLALEHFQGAVIMVIHSELVLRQMETTQLVVCRKGNQQLFQGTYEDFLSGPGWQDEGDQFVVKKDTAAYWENKQKRAAIIQERSRVLKPIEAEIQKAEKRIAQLEADCEKDHQALVEASQQQGQGALIQELGKKIAEKNREIDGLYQKLDTLSSSFEDRKKDYEQRLNGLP